jgi:hypothetical protein
MAKAWWCERIPQLHPSTMHQLCGHMQVSGPQFTYLKYRESNSARSRATFGWKAIHGEVHITRSCLSGQP